MDMQRGTSAPAGRRDVWRQNWPKEVEGMERRVPGVSQGQGQNQRRRSAWLGHAGVAAPALGVSGSMTGLKMTKGSGSSVNRSAANTGDRCSGNHVQIKGPHAERIGAGLVTKATGTPGR